MHTDEQLTVNSSYFTLLNEVLQFFRLICLHIFVKFQLVISHRKNSTQVAVYLNISTKKALVTLILPELHACKYCCMYKHEWNKAFGILIMVQSLISDCIILVTKKIVVCVFVP